MAVSLKPHHDFHLRPTAAVTPQCQAKIPTEASAGGPAGVGVGYETYEERTLCGGKSREDRTISPGDLDRGFRKTTGERHEECEALEQSRNLNSPIARSTASTQDRLRFVSRRLVSTSSSATSSFERYVALREKRRAESVSSVSKDGSSDENWSKGEGDPGVPMASTEWSEPGQRLYRFCTKKTRRRRKNDRPSERVVFGSFKMPEEPLRLPGFKDPPHPTASGTPPPPGTPIYLCKDGFDEAECMPERRSVFVPRKRHREITGLGALALDKPVLGPTGKCMPLSSPAPPKSRSFAGSQSSIGEVGLFKPGSGCGSSLRRAEPMAVGDSTNPANAGSPDTAPKLGIDNGLFSRLKKAECSPDSRVN